MIEMLAVLPPKTKVREVYAGATVAATPSLRLMTDESSAAASLVMYRLRMQDAPTFTSYHLHELDFFLTATSRDHPGQVLNPMQLWLLGDNAGAWQSEQVIIAILSFAGWNSASGGSMYTGHQLTEKEQGILEMLNTRVAPLPVFVPSDLQELRNKISNHYTSMVATYQEIPGREGKIQREIHKNALAIAIQNAQSIQPASSETVKHGCLSIHLAKDITAQDMDWRGNFWGDITGPGPKLYANLRQLVNGIPRSFLGTRGVREVAAKYGAFVDFWCVILE